MMETRPVIVLVADDDQTRQLVAEELRKRYGDDYSIIPEPSPQAAVSTLERLRADETEVPLVIADQWMAGMTGVELLARSRALFPDGRRALLLTWGDQATSEALLRASALGDVDYWVPRPQRTRDEEFHRQVSELLQEAAAWRPAFEAVRIVGEPGAPRSHEMRDVLTRNSVPFRFIAAESDEGRALLERTGTAALPQAFLFDGRILADPTYTEIADALGVHTRPPQHLYDLVVIGAGPAGLSAAVYGSSEGLATAMVEREAIGGQAGTSSKIRNYLGFPRGVGGAELAIRACEQALLFGTHFIYGNEARAVSTEGNQRMLTFADESHVAARAILIATGIAYRTLDIPSLEPFIGAGVFYGSAAAEAQAMKGGRVFVVGGGNSAGQAAAYLARFAERVTLLVRGPSLAESMSEYLIRELESAPNVELRFNVAVVGGDGVGHLERLVLGDRTSGSREEMLVDGLFVQVGADPRTSWLPGELQRDEGGYVLTGIDVVGAARPPMPLQTSIPGVFAAGDVRHGSVKRVASAVGEGAMSIASIHQYLGTLEGA
jgi:thioredoxin reductase (NADPH)